MPERVGSRGFLAGVLLVVGGMARAAPLPDAPCQVVSSQRVELASQIPGVLSDVLVDRGDIVRKGQLLAQLPSEVEQAQLLQAQARAQSDGQVRSRRAKLALTERSVFRNESLRGKNFISEQDFDQLRTERDIAAAEAAAAAEALAQARIEVQSARAALEVRSLRSPIDGVVTERDLNPGERVADKPVLVLERVDLLYAEVALPAALLTRLHVGSRTTLAFVDVPGLPPRQAEVSLIDPAVDPKSGTFGVRLNLDNADGKLPTGIKCAIDLGGPS